MVKKLICGHGIDCLDWQQSHTVKTKPLFKGTLYLFWVCETKTGLLSILVVFQDRLMFSHIIREVSVRAFHWCG